MYGYIDNNRQFVRPDSVGYNDIAIFNPTDEQLAELGYLERVDTEPPKATGYVSYYVEIDGKAVQHWEEYAYVPTPEERIAALEAENAMLMECLLEMSEIVYA